MKVLFVIQLCEAKGLFDSSAYNEFYKPMMASGLIDEDEIISFKNDIIYYEVIVRDRIKHLRNKLNGSPVIVYGAGAHTEKYINELKNLNVYALSDREASLWGSECCGYLVLSPEEMIDTGFSIVISSLSYEESIIEEFRGCYPSTHIYGLYNLDKEVRAAKKLQIEAVRSVVVDFTPDLIVYSPNHPSERFNKEDVKMLRDYYRSKWITLWWDYDEITVNNSYLDLEKESLQYSDLILDAGYIAKTDRLRMNVPPYQDHQFVEKVAIAPALTNPDIFFLGNREDKVYDVAIFGGAFGDRKKWIDKLRDRYGVRFHHFGGVCREGEFLSMEEYAKRLRCTRIAVNTQTYPSNIFIKGKVKETISCGTFLLEEDNPDTRKFIPDDVGIAYFRDESELYEKIDYYLEYEHERERIALKAHDWFYSTYKYRGWFQRILNKI
jgi:hypothetical protein